MKPRRRGAACKAGVSSVPKPDVQDDSNFSPEEINRLWGKRFNEKKILFQVCDAVRIRNVQVEQDEGLMWEKQAQPGPGSGFLAAVPHTPVTVPAEGEGETLKLCSCLSFENGEWRVLTPIPFGKRKCDLLYDDTNKTSQNRRGGS